MLGQDVGFPVPEGGAGALAAALARRARSAGARIHAPAQVTRVIVGHGRALGVVTACGRRIRARRAVLADVAAPALYRDLLPAQDVPPRLLDEIERCFPWDLPTVKVNWALRGRFPVAGRGRRTGRHRPPRRGPVRHAYAWSVATSAADGTARTCSRSSGSSPPPIPTRAPEGAESLWAYSHLPRGVTSPDRAAELARRMARDGRGARPGLR